MPHASGIAEPAARLPRRASRPAAAPTCCRGALDYGVDSCGFDADAFVHELADAIDRRQLSRPRSHARALRGASCGATSTRRCATTGRRPATSTCSRSRAAPRPCATCSTAWSRTASCKRGDTIALGTPIFTPYLEIPQLEEFRLQDRRDRAERDGADGRHTWQYPDDEIAKLEDPRVKAFFLVNPSATRRRSRCARETHRAHRRRWCATSAPTSSSSPTTCTAPSSRASARWPPSCRATRSSSTRTRSTSAARAGGWASSRCTRTTSSTTPSRGCPSAERERLRHRYGSLSTEPDRLKFIDRMVADSRDVALNHTAGLSLPQQVQMTLFSLFSLLDDDDVVRPALPRDRARALREAVRRAGHAGAAR